MYESKKVVLKIGISFIAKTNEIPFKMYIKIYERGVDALNSRIHTFDSRGICFILKKFTSGSSFLICREILLIPISIICFLRIVNGSGRDE